MKPGIVLFFALSCAPAVQQAQQPDTLLLIKGGTFDMGDQFGDGSTDEIPVHRVAVPDFYLAPCELSTGEYLEFVNTTRSNYPAWLQTGSAYHYQTGAKDYYRVLDSVLFDPQRPIVGITWFNAVAYCNWRSLQKGLTPAYTIASDTVFLDRMANGFRLPTEAEWEYAAREGGKKHRFATGKDMAQSNDLNADMRPVMARSYAPGGLSRGCTLPVHSLQPNSLGLYHMSGNVWEWCNDWYAPDAYAHPDASIWPLGPAQGTQKVLRGGAWYFDAYHARCANRHHARPQQHFHAAGMRLARSKK